VLVLAALGKFSLWAAVLVDVGTALLVIGNGMLVLRWKRVNGGSHDHHRGVCAHEKVAAGLELLKLDCRPCPSKSCTDTHGHSHGTHSHHDCSTKAKSCPSSCCKPAAQLSHHAPGPAPPPKIDDNCHKRSCCKGNDHKHRHGHQDPFVADTAVISCSTTNSAGHVHRHAPSTQEGKGSCARSDTKCEPNQNHCCGSKSALPPSHPHIYAVGAGSYPDCHSLAQSGPLTQSSLHVVSGETWSPDLTSLRPEARTGDCETCSSCHG
jgi:hypothetical protein